MNLLLVSAIVGVGVAAIAWEIQLLVKVRRRERKAMQFLRAVDKMLGPVMKSLEEGLLEIYRCVTIVVTAMANEIAPPLDWLFNEDSNNVRK